MSIILNEFETLVSVGKNGTLEGRLAKSWRVAEDQKSITFELDERAKFSDGSPLMAADVKRAWEQTYREKKKQYLSGQPLFKNMVGIEAFDRSGEIDGIQSLDKKTLKIRFKTTVRLALFRFTDYAFCAYKTKNGAYIGTGPYKIIRYSNDEVELSANKYSSGLAHFKNVNIRLIAPAMAEESLLKMHIDAYFFAPIDELKICSSSSREFDCPISQEARREVLVLNGQTESRFSDVKLRRGLQAAFWKALETYSIPNKFQPPYFRLDPQVFLPFQAGRLDSSEAINLIKEGDAYIELVKSESHKRPFSFMDSTDSNDIENIFKSIDIRVSNPTGKVSSPQKMKALFSKGAPDIVSVFYLIFLGDPGALEHYLGRGGWMTSPLAFRKTVSDVLASGTHITNIDQIDLIYQKASRLTLKEVPFIHMGFRPNSIVYNSSKLRVNQQVLNRTELPLDILSPR